VNGVLASRVIKLKPHRGRQQEGSRRQLSKFPFLTEPISLRQFASLNRQTAELKRPATSRKGFRLAAILIGLAMLASAGWSQIPVSPEPLNSQDVGAFLDKYFAENMEKFHVPGASVAVVKNGEVIATKGYGYANVEQKIPADPDRTVFRLASVSKPFTAIAALQLVEQGKLRLDENVNHYLRLFQFEDNYPRPVTLQNLLTHTAGFDDGGIGITAHSAAEQIPLGTYLERRLGPRVTLPGDQYSYSNRGFSLAGYIVETTSGVPFAQYINDQIFKPLEMPQSGFVITPELARNLAVGYDYKKGRFVPVPLDYPNVVPAASLVSTARDMTHFMIAELQLGQYGSHRILAEDSAKRMFERQYTNDPHVPGTAFAYWEQYPNGTRAVRQDGDWMGAVSTVYFLPAQKVGIFIACNVGDQSLIDDLLRQFMDRYYPADPEQFKAAVTAQSPEPSNRFAGSYRLNRYAHGTFEKLGTLLHEWEVFAADKGGIVLLNPNVGPANYVPAGPLLFRREGTEDEIAFRQDENGRITRLALDRYVLEKLPWYETALVQKSLFAFFSCVFGLAILATLIIWAKNRKTGTPLSQALNDRSLASLRYWTAGVATGNLFFLGGMCLAFLNKGELAYGLPSYVAFLLCIPIVTTAAVPIILWQTFRVWRTRSGSSLSRTFYSLAAFAAVCFIPFLIYWNLLGFHY
jgi:CubicO group peptidase (beta-lactamase class C family)